MGFEGVRFRLGVMFHMPVVVGQQCRLYEHSTDISFSTQEVDQRMLGARPNFSIRHRWLP